MIEELNLLSQVSLVDDCKLSLPDNFNCISVKLFFFVSGTIYQTNIAPNMQNKLYIQKRPRKPIDSVVTNVKNVTANTKTQLVAVAKLVPYGLT